MKKLSIKRKLRNLRLSKYARAKRLKKKSKKKSLSMNYSSLERIHAPEVVDISIKHKRKKLIAFIEKIRNALIRDRKNICLDFSHTRQLVADGMILLVAELYRAIKVTSDKRIIKCVPPNKTKVREVFYQLGLFKKLSYEYKSVKLNDADIVNWRFASGAQVKGETYEEVLGPYNGRIAESLQSKLYVGIVEGMKNVKHHAHIKSRKDGLNVGNDVSDWWMFSQEREGFLTVILCDLGVGIPDTLPVKHNEAYQALVRMLTLRSGQLTDSEIIKQATNLMETRTGKSYRGRGLGQMVNEVTAKFGGTVRINSNRGCYTNNSGVVSLRDYDDSVLGTIVSWKVSLNVDSENG